MPKPLGTAVRVRISTPPAEVAANPLIPFGPEMSLAMAAAAPAADVAEAKVCVMKPS